MHREVIMATEIEHTTESSTGGETVFPPFDEMTFLSQIFWLVATFGIFYYVMAKFALPRVAGILESREDKIAGDLAERERLNAEIEEAESNYQQKKSEAHDKAHEIVRNNRESMNQEILEKKEKAETHLLEKLQQAEARIDEIKNKALLNVDEIATNTARELVISLIGGSEKTVNFSKVVVASKGNL